MSDRAAAARPRLILADSIFLGAMGLFGLSQDLLSYHVGGGRFGAFLLGDPRALGFVEAHGLAALVAAGALILGRERPAVWNGLLGSAHAFLGGCNLAFFETFVATGDTGFAALVTGAHFGWAALHASAWLRRTASARAG